MRNSPFNRQASLGHLELLCGRLPHKLMLFGYETVFAIARGLEESFYALPASALRGGQIGDICAKYFRLACPWKRIK